MSKTTIDIDDEELQEKTGHLCKDMDVSFKVACTEGLRLWYNKNKHKAKYVPKGE